MRRPPVRRSRVVPICVSALFLGGAVFAQTAAADESPTQLTNEASSCQRFSPDGQKLAYLAFTDVSGNGDLHVADVDGSNSVTVPGFVNNNNTCFVWSPDSTRLAYTDFISADYDVFVLAADGSSPPVNVSQSPGSVDADPAWSADGQSVLFRTNRFSGNTTEILSAPADGSGGYVNLTNTPGLYETGPQVSPDGSKIAFTRFGPDPNTSYGPPSVWVMDADGSNQHDLLAGTGHEGSRPFWSPDGTRLAYFDNPRFGGTLWVIDADGTNSHALSPGVGVVGGGDLFGNSPPEADWSPDSSVLAYSYDANLTGVAETALDIYTVNVDGTSRRKVTTAPSYDYTPRWTPSGGGIAYVSDRDAQTGPFQAIYEVPVPGPADSTPPVVTVTQPTEGDIYVQYASHVPVAYTCADPDTGVLECEASSNFQLNTFVLGPSVFQVRAVNGAGTETIQQVNYTVIADAPPLITLVSPTDGAIYQQNQVILIDFRCEDPFSFVALCNGSQPTGTLLDTGTPGTYEFSVQTRDGNGNAAVTTISYTVVNQNPDGDGDGVVDTIDTGAGSFADTSLVPPTVGSIVDAAGNTVVVEDAPAPDGVRILVSGSGSLKSVFSVCGSTLRLLPGSEMFVTCGSVTVRSVAGTAEIVLAGGTSVVSVPAGVTAKVTDTGGGGFSVQNLGGGTVSVTTNGTTVTVAPGQTSPVDTSPPVITATLTGTLGANGWYRGNVTVTWTVTDGQSLPSKSSGCATSTVSSDTVGVTKMCSATSKGGASSSSVVVKRDAKAPAVSFASHPSSYTVDQTVTINCTASDATSGIQTGCSPINAAAYTFAVGSNTKSTTVTDVAGNSKTASTSFTVKVTSASLCNLTKQFVHGSARYQSSTSSQKAAIDVVVNAGCAALNNRQTSIYKAGVTAAASNGWLTTSQATTLRSLADRL